MIRIKQNDIENVTDDFLKVLDDMNIQDIKDIVYRYDLVVSDFVKIVKFYNYDNYEISINLNKDIQYLLSYITELDAIWYDAISVLFNDIVLNENDRIYANQSTSESQELELMLSDIENEIELLDDISTNPTIDINMYIDNLSFKEKINTELLKEKIEKGINDLLNMINNQVMDYFEHEMNELISECEYYNIKHLTKEIENNGYYDAYL